LFGFLRRWLSSRPEGEIQHGIVDTTTTTVVVVVVNWHLLQFSDRQFSSAEKGIVADGVRPATATPTATTPTHDDYRAPKKAENHYNSRFYQDFVPEPS
jgi:hypothetical protein